MVVFDKDVKTHALAVVADIDGLFCDWIRNLPDADAEDFLDEPLADALVLHDFEEQEVVTNRELLPRLDFSHGIASLISILRRI